MGEGTVFLALAADFVRDSMFEDSICRGDAPEHLSLSAQRLRCKRNAPHGSLVPDGQPRERTPERDPQLLAIQAKSCLAGFPAGHPRPRRTSARQAIRGRTRQRPNKASPKPDCSKSAKLEFKGLGRPVLTFDSRVALPQACAPAQGRAAGRPPEQALPVFVGWGECSEPQHPRRLPRWGALRLPQPTFLSFGAGLLRATCCGPSAYACATERCPIPQITHETRLTAKRMCTVLRFMLLIVGRFSDANTHASLSVA